MVKKNLEENKKTVEKSEIKKAKKVEKEAILNEKKKYEDKIDKLIEKLKSTKDKKEKKELKKEINELKSLRSKVGKKDTFLGDVVEEMKLVRWPSAKEVFKYSIASLIFVLFFAIFFFGFDALFALIKGWLS